MQAITPHKIRRHRRGTPAFGDGPKDSKMASGRKSSLQEKPTEKLTSKSPLKFKDRLDDVKKYGSLKEADE